MGVAMKGREKERECERTNVAQLIYLFMSKHCMLLNNSLLKNAIVP
jgi:hypothetical protein